MKPTRMAMTHHLVLGYGLHKKMEVYVSAQTTSGVQNSWATSSTNL
jgi:hypothetical protein